MHQDYMSIIHGRDIYTGFDMSNRGLMVEGGGYSNNSWLTELIRAYRPVIIVEVGTWLGRSAIHMARTALEVGLDPRVFCVDTWMGGTEQYLNYDPAAPLDTQRWYTLLNLVHGFPTVYFDFLANVVLSGLQEVVIPIPNTSHHCAVRLEAAGVLANLVYVDGGHLYEEVLSDLWDYWRLLAPGGVMCGDDYNLEGVCRAVDLFAAKQDMRVELMGERLWVLRARNEA